LAHYDCHAAVNFGDLSIMVITRLIALLCLQSCGGMAMHTGSSHYNGVEFALESREEIVYPILGVAKIRGDNDYVYAGLQYVESMGELGEYMVSFSAGRYQAESLDLGLELEFRTAVEIFPHPNIGVGYVHMSNAGLGELNPGFDAFFITVRF
jgi:hypothetical protein